MSLMQKLQKTIYAAIIASEASHVFCCVLPTVFSALSVLAGLGMISAMPGWMESVHELLHGWEVPMIIVSAAVLALGWMLHWYSKKMDCDDLGDGHAHCESKKDRASLILKIATLLFLVNVTVYGALHRGIGVQDIEFNEKVQSDIH